MPLSPSELEAIRGRAEAATNPPWSHWPQTSLSIRPRETVMAKTGPGLGCLIGEEITEPDATFIAHARTDVPALLDEVERLNGELSRALRLARPEPYQVAYREMMRFRDDEISRADNAEARIAELEDINAGLRKWQDVLRPSLEAIRLAAWDVVHAPTCGALDVRLVDDAECRKLMEAFESEAT